MTISPEEAARSTVEGVYSAADRYPFHRLEAERYFFLCAANQLLRALTKTGDEDPLPADLELLTESSWAA